MDVRSISPAPNSAASKQNSTASISVSFRPPCVNTFHFSSLTCFASTATTIVDEPYLFEASEINALSLTAAVLIETLSAPECSSLDISSIVLTPPPTVRGIKQFSAVFFYNVE